MAAQLTVALRVLLCLSLAGILGFDIVSAQNKADTSGVRVTVIGCVQRSEPPVPEAVGKTVIAGDETKYLLSNITLVPDDRAASSGNTSTGNLVAQAVKMYRLDDSADSLIAPHVGDRVRVTGMVVATPPSPRDKAGRTESPTVSGARPPTLRVESMQKISSDSATCSQ